MPAPEGAGQGGLSETTNPLIKRLHGPFNEQDGEEDSHRKEDTPPKYSIMKPHLSAVMDLAIDQRTRFLLSGDNEGVCVCVCVVIFMYDNTHKFITSSNNDIKFITLILLLPLPPLQDVLSCGN